MADIYFRRTEDGLEVSVVDHEKGFESLKRTPTEQGGFGLFEIREHLHLLGGKLEVTSAHGFSTTTTIVVPINHCSTTKATRSDGP